MAFIFTPNATSIFGQRGHATPATHPVRASPRVGVPRCTRRHTMSWIPRMSAGVGSPPVDFSLPITDGSTLTLSELLAKSAISIIYFYPKDATSGCSVEAGDFRDLLPEFEKLGASVVGVSRDSVESHEAFAKDLGLTFPLIADDGTLSEGYGVYKLKKLGDMEIMAVERSTFVIRGGVVVKEWRGVKSGGHVKDVLEAVKQL